jgi:hypothetical protein
VEDIHQSGQLRLMLRSEADEYFSVDEIVLRKFTLEDWSEVMEGKCIAHTRLLNPGWPFSI